MSNNMNIEELRETYYEEIKSRYLGLKAALDYNQAAYDADVAQSNAAIENLAKTYYPEYDGEFFHRYYDDDVYGRDVDDEQEEFFDSCRDAYKQACSMIWQFAGEWKIRERHQAVRSEIVDQLREVAEQATENFPLDFWIGEPWENELKRWNGGVRGVETP